MSRQELKPFHEAFGLFAAAMVATVGFGWITYIILEANISVPSADEIITKFGLLEQLRPIIIPEPAENATFLLTYIAGLALLSISVWVSISIAFGRTARILLAAVSACAAIGAAAWVFGAFGGPGTFEPAGLVAKPLKAHPISFLVLTVFCAAVIMGVAMRPTTEKWKLVAVGIGALPFALLASFSILGNDDLYLANGHYEVFIYPLIQDWLGTGINAGVQGQLSQYGMYPLLLRPIWFIAGEPSARAVTTVMATLLFGSFLFILSFTVRFTLHPVLAACTTLAAVMGTLLVFPTWPLDPFFQFFPVRVLFPSLAMGLLSWKATREDHRFVSYLLLSTGLVWNFESGVVGLVIYGVFVLAAGSRSNLLRVALRQAIFGAGAVAIVAGSVLVYYLVRFGSPPDLLAHLQSIRIFSAGVGALPMPAFGAWGLPCFIYGASVFVGLRSLFTSAGSEDRDRAAALLAISAAGIIWFRYYQGRSHVWQLQYASLPAWCCAALLIDRLVSQVSARYPRFVAVSSSAIGAPLLAALLLWSLGPEPPRSWKRLARSSHSDAAWNSKANEIISAFEKVKRAEGDELVVLAPYAYLISLKRGKPGPIHSAGLCQIWYESELDQVMQAVADPAVRMVVLDRSITCRPVQSERLDGLLNREFEEMSGPCDAKYFVRRGTPSRVNVAEGKRANQSTNFASTANAAVDGNVDGVFSHGSTTHTELQTSPWWEVDLGSVREINSIEVWNRTDCCGDRLRDFWILASEERLPTDTRPDSLAKRQDVHSSFVASTSTSTSCHPTTIKAGYRARFLRVQLNGTGYLSLAEVRVLADKASEGAR